MLRLLLIALIFIGVLSSCGKEEEEKGNGTVNFRFQLTYGGQPLEMFKEYPYPVTGDKFRMSRLSFFLSELSLSNTSGKTLLKDIDYLNLTAAHTAPVASNGFEYKIDGIAPGNYNGVSFGIGVPPALNVKIPPDFPPGSVLSGTAEYWSAWKSYIFFRPEGKIGLNGSNNIDTNFALHLGGNEGYRVFDSNRAIEVLPNKVTNVDVYIDVQQFFNGTSPFNIRETQQIHSLSQMPLIKILADNLVSAVSVE